MTATVERYAALMMRSGKLKMRATSMLAEGARAAVFDACVMLHEASRLERRALAEVPSPTPESQLVAAAEECFCLVEGCDPPAASTAWETVVLARTRVDADAAGAILARLAPRYEQMLRDFQSVLVKCKSLMANLRGGHGIPASPDARAEELRDVQRVLKRFPGAAGFWWRRHRLLEADGAFVEAWGALSNALRLEPERATYRAVSLVLAVKALPHDEADAYVQRGCGALEALGAAECLMYALAELELAEKRRDPARWQRARDAVDRGLMLHPPVELAKNLRATGLILDALLSGREPTLDLLYEVGLGAEVAAAPPGGRVLDLVALRTKQQVSASPLAA